MKNLFTLLVLSLFFFGCNSDTTAPDGQQTAPATDAAATTNPGKVWHYTCPNNHPNGGSDAQGSCSVCQTALAHNQAWHSLPENLERPQVPTSGDQTSPIITTTPTTTPAITPTTTNPAPENPAQNAAGVYHYVCSAGCAGGAGAEGACGTCGAALTHNAAYHN